MGTSTPSADEWRGHLGRKVSIRYAYRGDPAHPFSEAIGVVSSVRSDVPGAGIVTILTRRGESVEVPIDDVLAVKVLS